MLGRIGGWFSSPWSGSSSDGSTALLRVQAHSILYCSVCHLERLRWFGRAPPPAQLKPCGAAARRPPIPEVPAAARFHPLCLAHNLPDETLNVGQATTAAPTVNSSAVEPTAAARQPASEPGVPCSSSACSCTTCSSSACSCITCSSRASTKRLIERAAVQAMPHCRSCWLSTHQTISYSHYLLTACRSKPGCSQTARACGSLRRRARAPNSG